MSATTRYASIEWRDCQGKYSEPNTTNTEVGHTLCNKPFGISCIHELHLDVLPRGILRFCRMCPQTEGIQRLPPHAQRANIGMSK